jgi:hypothetical protein
MIDDNKACYLCGNELKGETDRDHVPPRQFYARELRKQHSPSLFTLPVHSSCNKAYQRDEDYFVHAIAPLAMESYSGNAIWKDIAHQYTRPQGVIVGKMILKEFDKRPSGLYLPGGKVVKRFNGERAWRVVWKIVRGLFFKEHLKFLPEDTLTTYYKLVSVGEPPPPEFDAVRDTPSRGQYPAVFDYKYIVVPEVDNFHLWAMLFWDRLIKMIGFHDPECPCPSCQERKERQRCY